MGRRKINPENQEFFDEKERLARERERLRRLEGFDKAHRAIAADRRDIKRAAAEIEQSKDDPKSESVDAAERPMQPSITKE